jgi:hypothetical protein
MSKIHTLLKGDLNVERLILQGCIVDKIFLSEIIQPLSVCRLESPEVYLCLDWIKDFYNKTKEAPEQNIKQILEANKNSLSKEEFEVLYRIVRMTLKEYAEKPFNTVYIKKKALEYLKARSLQQSFEKGLFLLQKGMYEEALLANKEAQKLIQEKTSEIVDVHDVSKVESWFFKKTVADLRFRNVLDTFLPPIQRGRYYGIYGRAKVGKSYWLEYFAQKSVEYNLKVFIVSCEMDEDEWTQRYTHMLLGKKMPENFEQDTDPFSAVPMFDCLRNQKGSCEFSIGSNTPVQSDDNLIGPYEDFPRHKPCTKCLGTAEHHRFIPSTWLKKTKVGVTDFLDAKNILKGFSEHSKGKAKLRCYPIGSCTVESVIRDLDYLETYEDFIPDVVIYDYPQIFKKRKGIEHRLAIGEVHEGLASLAKERHHIGIAGIQANRTGNNSNRLTTEHLAEDISAIMTVDAIIAVNSCDFKFNNFIETDRYWKRQRLEVLLCRYKEFMPNRQLLTLENRDLGQIFLDGIIVNAKG